MPRISSKHFENFGDGLLTICEADERSLTRTKLEHIRFGNRTVGVTRYWQAQTAGNQVDKLLAVPLEVLDAVQIEVNDVIILENETDWLWDNMTFDESEMKDRAGHYQIKQVQPKYDTKPPALYLSLEKLVAIKIGDLAKTVMKELDDYGVAVGLEVEKVSKEVAEDTAKILNKTSPKLTGDYAASWTYGTGETKRTKHTMVVHADKPEYALTHLLEKGHQKRGGGRTKAIVHIAPAEEAAVDELEKELRTRL